VLDGKSVLITGGTGSFGREATKTLLREHPGVARVIIYSRDELKQFEMQQDPELQELDRDKKLRFFIGDVRDKSRLMRAMDGVDVVFHAAALKQVPAAEYNPFEAVKTNIIGAQNLIDCCMDAGVKRIVALSTDKAAGPINLYGATKLCSDKMFVAANNFRGARDLRFSVVRYGNVMGSRGSVIPFFLKLRDSGVLPITHAEMTRFNITLEEGVRMVMNALGNMLGGEVFVPKIPSYRILDVAEAIAPGSKLDDVGIRPGEKLHEEMITEGDSMQTAEFEDYFVILPSVDLWDIDQFVKDNDGKRCDLGFSYNSGRNTEWLTVSEIRQLIREHVDPAFDLT
jgi:UDP-N-acetylglucosamine 4,6-dehydratase